MPGSLNLYPVPCVLPLLLSSSLSTCLSDLKQTLNGLLDRLT